jgi:catalase
MFGQARTYACYVRFSNGVGSIQSDSRPDVRGLAVKVIGVPGKKLLEGEEHAVTQDFLCTNSPVSLARNAKQFMAFASANLNPLTLPFTLGREIGAREAARITAFLATSLARPIRSLAVETFWSGGPIKFGPYAAKLLWRPEGADPAHGILPGRDGLRKDLKERLEKGDVRYDLYLQFFVDEARTPIEDTSLEWLENVAPPVKVARLVIKQRNLESEAAQREEEFVNSLAFTPWHCTEDLRPIGHTMRARRVVYKASATLRHHLSEPTETNLRFR